MTYHRFGHHIGSLVVLASSAFAVMLWRRGMSYSSLRRNFLVTAPWKVGTCISNQVKSAALAADKLSPNVETNKIRERNTVAYNENNSSQLPFSSMPGPGGLKKLPYIGTALMFKPFSAYTPETMHKLAHTLHDLYGSVFKIRLGKSYTVFTDDAQDAENVFRADDMYPLRQTMTLVEVFQKRNNLPLTIGTVSGPEWMESRRPLSPLLNRPEVVLHYLPAQNQVANDFVRRLQTIKFSADELSEEFFKFTSESIGVVCFNKRLGFLNDDLSNSPDALKLLEAYKTVLHCIYLDLMGIERGYLKNDNDPFYKKFEDSMSTIRNKSAISVKEVMAELESRNIDRDQNSQTGNSSVIDSNLLASLIVGGKLGMTKILSLIETTLIAGSDSTARNLAVLFYNLAMNPQVQGKVAKEVIDLIGHDGPVVPETLTKLNYLKACVKESMRINFPLPNGAGRILSSEVNLSGYQVPKGTSIVMSSNRSSVSPKYFTDPLKFLPERWLREASDGERVVEKKASAFAFLPFGHGPRGCVGRRLAEQKINVGAAKVLQKLEIKVDPSYLGLDLVYKSFITPKEPIPFIFKERRN